jgi:transposase
MPDLTPLQFHALLPFILPRSPQGRRISDLRERMNGIFHMASGADPWRCLPQRYGKPDTVCRYFRRLTQAGLWERLLVALKDCNPTHPLWEIAKGIFRACRRAVRLRGLRFIMLIRRLGFIDALNGPPDKVPNPAVFIWLKRLPFPPTPTGPVQDAIFLDIIRILKRLHRKAGGVPRLPRATRLAWS